MSSRISRPEAGWFVDRAMSAPWHAVPAGADLRGADPLVSAGLYDAAVELYRHFDGDRPVRVNWAKVSNCLYLTRPRHVPLLDSRLAALYRRPA